MDLQIPPSPLDKIQFFDLPSLMEQKFTPLKWTVEDIIPEGCVVLAGRQSAGKRRFAMQLALAVASGGKALEHIPVEQNSVLYMAFDDTRRRLQLRAKQLLGDKPIPEELRFVTNWPAIDEGGAEALEYFLEYRPQHRLVIIDNFRKIKSRKNGGEHETLMKLAEIALKFEICLLIIHHTRRADGDDSIKSSSGPVEISSIADAMLVLKRSRYQTYSELHISGRDIEEKKLALRFYSDTLAWELIGDADKVLISDTRKEIIKVLREKNDDMTPSEIADAIDRKPASIRKVIQRMLLDGQLTSFKPGHYAVWSGKDSIAKEKAFDEAEAKQFFQVDPFRKLVTAMRQKGIRKAFAEMGFAIDNLAGPDEYKHLM
ncbi:MAG TPA: AAA family ATPase [Blastocatellia bacterium]|nr:AAA family ATPase [Blastocatellia bacterium]